MFLVPFTFNVVQTQLPDWFGHISYQKLCQCFVVHLRVQIWNIPIFLNSIFCVNCVNLSKTGYYSKSSRSSFLCRDPRRTIIVYWYINSLTWFRLVSVRLKYVLTQFLFEGTHPHPINTNNLDRGKWESMT